MKRFATTFACLAFAALLPTAPSAQPVHLEDPIPSGEVAANASPWAPSLATWRRLDAPVSASGMSGRMGTYMVHDPVRNRLVLFGGWGFGYFDDTWALSLSTPSAQWMPIAHTGPRPGERLEHTTVYDPIRHRMLLFGGKDLEGFLNDVWALDLATDTWSQLVTAGAPPSPRESRAIYDSVRDRVVLFGGFGPSTGHLNETWALELASGTPTWRRLAPWGTLPLPRRGQSTIYDPVADRLVLFGGYDDRFFLDDLWVLTFGDLTWRRIPGAGAAPSGRYGHAVAYDPARREMVLFGGYNGAFLDDGAVLSLAAMSWQSLAASPRPSPRDFHTMAFDPARDRIVLAAGNAHVRVYNDSWSLDLATRTWSPHDGPFDWPAVTPPARLGHDTAYDPIGDRMIVFGGWDDDFYDDTWALSLGSSAPEWSEILSSARPSPRQTFPMVYDSRRHRMLLFGGKDWEEAFGDLWQLDLASSVWSPLTQHGPRPSARESRAIYDPVRDQLVLFGGYNNDEGHLNDTWVLDLSGPLTWRRLELRGSVPDERRGHTLAYDPRRQRMLLFGGYDDARFMNDVWELRLSGHPEWRELRPRGTLPSGRFLHAAAYVPEREKLVMFGGWNGRFLDDGWVLDLHGNAEWTPLEATGPPPGRRDLHTMTYDPVRDRILMYGGNVGLVLGELWELALGEPATAARPRGMTTPDAGAAPASAPVFALRGLTPNPAAAELRVSFSLPSASPADVEMYDLAGRRVAATRIDAPRPGPQSVRLERGAIAPGVYLIRLAQDGRSAVTRGAVVR